MLRKLFHKPRCSRRTPQAQMAALEALEPRIVLAADGNDTMATALSQGSFGTTSSTFTKTGNVGSSGDSIDYYKFVLTGSNYVSVNMSGLSKDLDIQLQDSSGKSISSGTKTGTASEFVGAMLGSGTYYVKVFKGVSSAVSNYSLAFKLGDDSQSTAFNFGSFGTGTTTTSTISSSVGGSDTADYYAFTLTGSNLARVSLTGLTADLDVEILNSSGTRMSAGTSGGTSSETPSAMLAAGTYYVRVFKGLSSSSSNYKLSIKFGDDARADATNFGTVGSGANLFFNSSIGGSDSSDYYKFVLSSTKGGQVNLTGLTADLDVEILNSNGTRIGTAGTKSGTASETLNFSNFAAGTYYLRIFKGTSSAVSNYRIGLKIN